MMESWYRFQVETVNSQLPRAQNTKKDERVPHFIPDEWQVKFLTAVDDKQSIIILAPTASGKTYASEYAMKRTSEHGLCIYVSPTKALVNQVAATVYARLTARVGVFTRDFRRDIDVCKILVTVPQCLEILLLSPNHQKLRNKLEYVIFDEIHCMGTELGDDVWEKCMLMCNTPMIGLSATVSNGDEVYNWWTRIEKRRSELYMKPERQVNIIRYNERLADLNKYRYSGKELYPMHPIGIMNSKQLIERGSLPVDLSLSPKETLQLHDALQETLYATMIPDRKNDDKLSIITTTTTTTVSKSSPSPLVSHFGDDWTVERTKCNKFSEDVLQQFRTMIEKNEVQKIDSVIQNINKGENQFEYPERKQSANLIVEFISMLRDRDLLPCIVFSDSRRLCEQNATTVGKDLERKEEKLRSGRDKQRMDKIKQELEEIEKDKKRLDKRSIRNKEECVNNDDMRNGLNGVDSDFYYKYLPECTLIHRKADKEMANRFVMDAKETNPELVKLIERGVAYHHSGLNAKGRVAVEALFRNRYIQVVFATSTLALGIHMPTKTVAFVRDSIHLDALNYRQESGRSGRRGFDVQGHVVFVDIPLSKIRHLTISRIPDIAASFPTSITLLMRLLHLYKMSGDENTKIDSCNRALILMECSFMSTLSNKNKILADVQLHYHFLYSLQLLYRLHLVNGKGNLVGIAGLLTHLYYYEPGNILLGYLINEKLFHTTESLKDIVSILAFMFTSQPWHVTPAQRENLFLERTEKRYSSTLFLPSMSERFIQMVHGYNEIVKEVYICYIQDVIKILREELPNEECILPISNISFYEKSDYDDGTFEHKLKHHYTQQPSSAISPFAGLSGLTDEQFMQNYNATSYDLAFNIDLSNKVVPFMDPHDYNKMNLNSYALDFYINGNKSQLIVENQLQAGDIFNFTQDFLLLLASIKTSLQTIVEYEEQQTAIETDLDFFRSISNKFDEIHRKYKESFSKAFPHRKYRI
ncbi:unnamed protein product [Adineta steineri]|uniref:DEAD/DEAH box helicase n=1 Tax=Adineta steineri TaxID=433720 RepID=A0A814RJ97_9BILA|nr:unnamed protein product [Adineta steineri]